MNPDHPQRRRRRSSFQAEALETRALLTGGAGSTFAIMRSTIDKADVKATVPFMMNASLFTLTPRHQITLGIDVAPQKNSSVIPRVVGVMDLTAHRMIPVTRTMYSPSLQRVHPEQGPLTTAVLVTIRTPGGLAASHQYAATIEGSKHSTGDLLVGFYLPGDSNGDGVVDNSDIQMIKAANNAKPGDAKYDFAVDANRDGRIDNSDLRLALGNLGAKVNISPVVSANLDAKSDSGLQDRVTNIRDVHFNGVGSPGARITYDEASMKAPAVSTTADAKGHYDLVSHLGDGVNSFRVTATDGFGQTISGLIAPVTYSINAAPSVTSPSPTTATKTS